MITIDMFTALTASGLYIDHDFHAHVPNPYGTISSTEAESWLADLPELWATIDDLSTPRVIQLPQEMR